MIGDLWLDSLEVVAADADRDCDKDKFHKQYLAVASLPKSGEVLEVDPRGENPADHNNASGDERERRKSVDERGDGSPSVRELERECNRNSNHH